MTIRVLCEGSRVTELICEVIPMGEDLTIAVYGGEKPHVGAAVMAVARPSLTGEGISATSSILARTGHKDDYVARQFAEAAAIRRNSVCVCTCGIHMDDLTPEELQDVTAACDALLEKVMEVVI